VCVKFVPNGLVLEHHNMVFAIRVAAAVWSRSFLRGVAQRKFVVVDVSTS